MWTYVLGITLYGRVANAFSGACCLGRSHTGSFLSQRLVIDTSHCTTKILIWAGWYQVLRRKATLILHDLMHVD